MQTLAQFVWLINTVEPRWTLLECLLSEPKAQEFLRRAVLHGASLIFDVLGADAWHSPKSLDTLTAQFDAGARTHGG